VEVIAARLRGALAHAPTAELERHAFVDSALESAAFAANLAVIHQVLLAHGDRPPPVEMRALARAVREHNRRGRNALAAVAAAVVIGDDLYTFTTGDAVVGLFRPSRPAGRAYIHLTNRDQAVVELFCAGTDTQTHGGVYQNQITASLGDSVTLRGTLRRYPDLLEPGDHLVASTDGLGPRSGGGGLDRSRLEAILAAAGDGNVAAALVRGQLADLDGFTYQDNIGVAVVTVAQ
jgi:serine/threonine protein phosphatase PrpC